MTVKIPWISDVAVRVSQDGRHTWLTNSLLVQAVHEGRTLFDCCVAIYVTDVVVLSSKLKEAVPTTAWKLYENGSTATWVWEQGCCDLNIQNANYVVVYATSFDKEEIAKLKAVVFSCQAAKATTARHVYVIGRNSNGGLQFFGLGVAGIPLERGNYTPEVCEVFDRVQGDLASPSPEGRLAVFDGPPGSGKTFLVRALIEHAKNSLFVYLPISMVEMLMSPEMVTLLIQKKASDSHDGPIVLVLEDADAALVPRGSENLSLISTLLNMTSGILGSMLDIRAIATTNSEATKIDPALLRPGRLSGRVTVGPLPRNIHEGVFRRLTGKELPAGTAHILSLAETYKLARKHGWTPPPEEAKDEDA